MSYTHVVVLSTRSENVDIARGSLFFVGTATVLLRYAGFTLLTDPNFLHQGDYVHLGYGLRSVRLTDPAIELAQLPPLDLVVLSHMHEDHFDRTVIRKLEKTTPIVTTPQAANFLAKKHFIGTYPLKTWQTLTMIKGQCQLHITAMPGKHAPGIIARALPPVMGSMLEFETSPGKISLHIYITGDTLLHKQLKEIPRRYPAIDLALLHLGGTKILGVLLTMNAKQGIKAIKLINPHMAIPIHNDDYDVFKSPLEDFAQAVTEAKLGPRVKYLAHGETHMITVSTANTSDSRR